MLQTVSRPITLKESALVQLREAITLGQLQPGQRLVERVMCEQLGVSRTVIRECIRHLESERLVTTIPNAGPTVATLTAADVEEIYSLRMLIEGSAVRSCTENATDEDIQALRAASNDIAAFLKDGDIIGALRATTSFYESLFTAGDRLVSWDLFKQLNGRVSWLRAMTLSSKGRQTAGPRNIRRIVRAIAGRDADAAVAACELHIAEAREIALRELHRTDES